MGIFDFKEQPYIRPERLNASDSFMAIMYSLVMADGLITDDEMNDLCRSVQRTSFMRGMTQNEFNSTIERLRHILKNEGPEEFLRMACTNLPNDLKEGAYIIATDLSYSDGQCTDDEKAILNIIGSQLGISQQIADATRKVISIKNSI